MSPTVCQFCYQPGVHKDAADCRRSLDAEVARDARREERKQERQRREGGSR